MESSSTSLVIDVLKALPGSNFSPPFGTLYISNSDGTKFRASMNYTNRDLNKGTVDFERIGSKFFEGFDDQH
jgi:Sortilin, neurotensin receptor 3,